MAQKMRYDSITIANKLIRLSQKDGKEGLDPLVLIKLVYLCNGWYLGIKGKPLIKEDVMANKFGPVIEKLYKEVQGPDKIRRQISGGSKKKISKEDSDFIESVYNSHEHLSGIQLSSLTHQLNSPWDAIWKKRKIYTVIPKDYMKIYFRRLWLSVPEESL